MGSAFGHFRGCAILLPRGVAGGALAMRRFYRTAVWIDSDGAFLGPRGPFVAR